MSIQFGGGSQEQKQKSQQQGTTTTTINMPATPETAGAAELNQLNIQLAKSQIAAQQKALADAQAFSSSPLGQDQAALEAAVTKNLLARINGTAPVLSPEAQARIDTAFNASRVSGEKDINRSFLEDANARGLSITDTAIANAKGSALADFLRGLESAKATSALNVGDTEANFNQGLAQFQAALRNQAAMNRMAMASNSPASFGLANSLFGQGLSTAGRTQTGNIFGSGNQSGTNSFWGYGQNAQQTGQGIGAIGGLFG